MTLQGGATDTRSYMGMGKGAGTFVQEREGYGMAESSSKPIHHAGL